MDLRNSWLADSEVHVDAFVTVNLAFMVLDIFLAHSSNQFRYQPEYIPVWFSILRRRSLLVGLFFADSNGKTAHLERPRPLRRLDIRFGGSVRRHIPPPQSVFLRADLEEPHLCRTLRGAARIYRPVIAVNHESNSFEPQRGMGAMVNCPQRGRLRRQLRSLPYRPRGQRILSARRVDSSDQCGVCHGVPHGTVPGTGDSQLLAALRRGYRIQILVGIAGFFFPVAASLAIADV